MIYIIFIAQSEDHNNKHNDRTNNNKQTACTHAHADTLMYLRSWSLSE